MKKYLIVSALAILTSCSSTSVVNSWKDPSETVAGQNFQKVMVVALMKNEATRRNIENEIAAINPGLIKPSYDQFNALTENLSKDEKMKILHDEKYDGVITMRLVSKEKETNYVPGRTTYYAGYPGYLGYYGGYFGGWYGMYGAQYYTPSYYSESTYYLVETNIFSLTKNKLIWSGTTKTLAGSELMPMVDDVIKSVRSEMQKDGSMSK